MPFPNVQSQLEAQLNERGAVAIRTAAATVAPGENVNHIYTAGGAFTLTLPPAHLMAGQTLSFYKFDASTNACTLADSSDSLDWGGDYTLDAANDSIVLFCDGYKYHAINNEIA